MSVKISELPILDSLADNDIVAGVDVSGNVTSKIEMGTLKNYIDTNTQYTAGTNIDITNNVVSAPNVYNKDEMDSQIEELQSEVDSLSMIYNAFPTESGEGESLTLDGTAEVKFKKFDLKGNTSQTGTPTPSSPIPVNVVSGDNEINVIGKNLLNPNLNVKLVSGVSVGNSGNLTAYATTYTTYIEMQPNKTYVFSGNLSNVNANVIRAFVTNNEIALGTSVLRVPNLTNGSTYTNSSNYKYLVLEFLDVASYESGWQLEVGSTSSTYEAYNGNTYNIDLPVENLIDTQYFQQGSIDASTGQDSSSNTNARGSNYIFVLPNTTYTISANKNLYQIRLSEYQSNYTHIKRNSSEQNVSSYTITTSANCYYVRWSLNYNNSTSTTQEIIDSIDLQLEQGSKATKYTPYGTTPIEMCKIGDYQDYFYKSDGNWYKYNAIGKIVLTGSNDEGWTLMESNTNTGRFVANTIITDKPAYSYTIETFYNNRFPKAFGNTEIGNIDTEAIAIRDNKKGFTIRALLSVVTNLAGFKTWLSNNNVVVYYTLATPTSTQITYQPLIDQLNAIEQAMSKQGQTNISQINNDKPFIITAEAIKDLGSVLDRIELLES